MLGSLSVGWWSFWLAVGAALFVGLVWVVARLAVGADEQGAALPAKEETPKGASMRTVSTQTIVVSLGAIVLFAIGLFASLGFIPDRETGGTVGSVPAETAPAPSHTMPSGQTMPGQTMPAETMPEETTPESMPGMSMP